MNKKYADTTTLTICSLFIAAGMVGCASTGPGPYNNSYTGWSNVSYGHGYSYSYPYYYYGHYPNYYYYGHSYNYTPVNYGHYYYPNTVYNQVYRAPLTIYPHYSKNYWYNQHPTIYPSGVKVPVQPYIYHNYHH